MQAGKAQLRTVCSETRNSRHQTNTGRVVVRAETQAGLTMHASHPSHLCLWVNGLALFATRQNSTVQYCTVQYRTYSVATETTQRKDGRNRKSLESKARRLLPRGRATEATTPTPASLLHVSGLAAGWGDGSEETTNLQSLTLIWGRTANPGRRMGSPALWRAGRICILSFSCCCL